MLRFIACNGSGICFRVASSTRTLVKSHSTTGNLVEKLFLLLQQWSSAMSSSRYGFYVYFGASVIDSSEISHSLSRFSSCIWYSYKIYHQWYFFLNLISHIFFYLKIYSNKTIINYIFANLFLMMLWYLHYNFTVFLPLSLKTYNFNLRD